MRFGPLSPTDLEKLKGLLDSQGASYFVEYSEEDLASERESYRQRPPTMHPNFHGPMNYLYIEIELKDLMIVRGELERMGFAVNREIGEPLPEVHEYLCRKCNFVGTSPGLCPVHQIELLEFSDYAEHLRSRGFISRPWKYIVFLLIAIGAIYGIWKMVEFSLSTKFVFEK